MKLLEKKFTECLMKIGKTNIKNKFETKSKIIYEK